MGPPIRKLHERDHTLSPDCADESRGQFLVALPIAGPGIAFELRQTLWNRENRETLWIDGYAQLVPRQRNAYRCAGPRARRVRGDRGVRPIVPQVIDQNLARAARLRERGGLQLGLCLLESFAQGPRELEALRPVGLRRER